MRARFVGKDARCSELRTGGHDEVMLGFVDWVLASEVKV